MSTEAQFEARRKQLLAALERTDLTPAQRAIAQDTLDKIDAALERLRNPVPFEVQHPDFGPIDQPPVYRIILRPTLIPNRESLRYVRPDWSDLDMS